MATKTNNSVFATLNAINVNEHTEKKTERDRDEKGRYQKSHGMRRTKIYGVWCSMKERCGNSNHKSYKHYGAKGISVCDEWKNSFAAFFGWAISNGYKEGLTIDRIDVNGNYCPMNCKWVTYAQQNRNYSRNHFITYNGETLCLKDTAEKYGIKSVTLQFRLKSGYSIEEALLPIDKRTKVWKQRQQTNSPSFRRN